MATVSVGDTVVVPGDMYGVVKFIGPVAGKKGTFAGVQLAAEYAPRGKNSGEVEGRYYFKTTIPGSGIFLPLEKAVKRGGAVGLGGFRQSPGPGTPTRLSSFNQGGRTPGVMSKPNFSQSVGPGARAGAASPALKPPLRRESLPRPSSPLRKVNTPTTRPLATPKTRPSGIGMAKSGTTNGGPGGGQQQYRSGPRPSNANAFSQSLRKGSSTPVQATVSPSLGPEVSFDEAREQETADSTPTPTPNHKGSADVEQYEVKVRELTEELGNARRQLREQGNNFAEMERSFNELQKILPTLEQESRQAGMGSGGGDDEDDLPRDVVTLREVLREKNEKIKLLTAEFDAHRADFRSTIDTLEMASTETERVYEKRVDELLDEVRTLQDRSEDVESVAQQLKQLEELVQELEEGLEDARRGEAEARGEVEFLRGEVERSRSELRRERERLKTEEQLSGYSPANVQDLETQLHAKDDEIRGLKAIIQNLNETQDEAQPPKTNGNGNSARKEQAPPEAEEQRFSLQQQIRDLEAVLQQKGAHEEELANEVKQLRNSVTLSRFPVPGSAFGIHTAVRSPHSRGNSDDLDRKHLSTGTTGSQRTVVLTPKLDKKQPDWHNNPKHVRVQSDDETNTSAASASTTALWCEICEEGGHDILTCSNMFGQQETKKDRDQNGAATAAVAAAAADITDRPAPLVSRKNTTQPPPPQPLPPPPAATLPSPPVHEQPPPPPPPAASAPVPVDGMLAGRSTGVIDPDKWCALCERDGHDSVDCPLEDAF